MLYCKHIGEIDMKYSEEIKAIEKDADVTFKEYCESIRKQLRDALTPCNVTEEEITRVMKENIDIIEGHYIHSYNYHKENNSDWRKQFDELGVVDGAVMCLLWLR